MVGRKKSKSKNNPHICEQCGKSFPFQSTLRYHERIHNGERPYKCQYCEKTFAQKSTQTIHERRHTGDRPYQCSFCEKSFASQGNMKIHERQHTGYKPYGCPTCQKRFATIGGLRTHEATHETPTENGERIHQYPCNLCDKVYAHRASLYVHKKQRHSSTATSSPKDSSTDVSDDTKDKLLIVEDEESKKKLACQYCGKRFAYRHPLLAHERTHTGERPYQCHFCPKAFAQQASLVMHERVHTGERRYRCETCDKRFIQAAALHAHKRTHTGERPYQCKLCEKAFAHATSLRQHQMVHARRAALEQRQQSSPETESSQGSMLERPVNAGQLKKAHVCVCGKEFAYRSLLEVHARTHTKPFVCGYCQRRFSQKAALQSHERTHTGERRSYSCPTCGKTLSSASALHTHKKTHGPRSYRCPSCPKTFTLRTYLRLHLRQVHTKTGKTYSCPLCGKEFSYAGSVQVHIRTHTGERPYVCKYCPKAFASQGNLQSHERTHTGVRPYCCETCGRCFAQRTQLAAHDATHVSALGDKVAALDQNGADTDQSQDQPLPMVRSVADYTCMVCGKRFAYASSLCVHMRLHTGERPYACRYCSKRFTNQGNMRVHERVHTGERPYKCPACDKRYAQKVGLRMHLDQCQQYLTAKTVVDEQAKNANNSVKAQKKRRLENLLPRLYSKSVPSMKPRRVGLLENSNSPVAESQHVSTTFLHSQLPTLGLAGESAHLPSHIASSRSWASQDQPLTDLEPFDKDIGETNEALIPSTVPAAPKAENIENDTDELSLYAAQMQKEFESCLLSLNCDGDQA